MSLALKRAIGLNKDTDDEALLDSGATASNEKDPNSKEKDQEEIAFIRGTFLQQMFLKSRYGSLFLGGHRFHFILLPTIIYRHTRRTK